MTKNRAADGASRPTGWRDQQVLDYCTPIGLALLGQLVRLLIESKDVLGFLRAEFDLKLDELATVLDAAVLHADGAFQAASLLHRRAALEASWSTSSSRPRAIHARHSAAVAAGAMPMGPVECWLVIEDPIAPTEAPPVDPELVGPPAATRSTCGHPTAKHLPCSRKVVMLDAHSEASGCQSHIYGQEREVHDTWQQKVREAENARTRWFRETAGLRASCEQQRQFDTAELWLRRQAAEFGYDLEKYLAHLGVEVADVDVSVIDEDL